MMTAETANPALPGNDSLEAALDEIRAVFLRRAITSRSQQMATMVAMLAVSIAEAARLSNHSPEHAAKGLAAASCQILTREVDTALAALGRPN